MATVLMSALAARQGSGFTYLRELTPFFPVEDGHRLLVLSALPLQDLIERPGVELVKAPRWTLNPVLRFLLGKPYFRWLWPRRGEFDVVYYGGGIADLPVGPRVRTAVAFRNMVPFDPVARARYGFGWQRLRNALLRYGQARTFERADLVVFVSDFARSVIDVAVPERRGASLVVSHGSRPSFDPLSADLAARLPERFVLYLSILEVYKSQVELVHAWKRLRAERPGMREKLVLAGPEYRPYGNAVRRAIAETGLGDEVVLLGPVPAGQVGTLYRAAVLNLFLSSCENCPNILLEMLRAGVPILSSNLQPMPELGGEGLEYVDPHDVPAVASAIGRLLDDPARRAAIAEAALAQGERYRWERSGARTWAALLALVEPKPPRQ